MADRNEAFAEWRKGVVTDDNLAQVIDDLTIVTDTLYAMEERGLLLGSHRQHLESAKSMRESRRQDRKTAIMRTVKQVEGGARAMDFHFERGKLTIGHVIRGGNIANIAYAAELNDDDIIEIREANSDEGRDHDEAWVSGIKLGEWR